LYRRGSEIDIFGNFGSLTHCSHGHAHNAMITPLHAAIENGLNVKVVKFLLKCKANPHIEDIHGKDCCDKAK